MTPPLGPPPPCHTPASAGGPEVKTHTPLLHAYRFTALSVNQYRPEDEHSLKLRYLHHCALPMMCFLCCIFVGTEKAHISWKGHWY